MNEFYAKNKIIVDKTAILAVFLIGSYIFIKYVFSYVSPFVVGFVISLILSPAVNFIHSRFRISRGITTFFLLIISILLVVVAGTALISRIVNEAASFADTLPKMLDDSKDFFSNMRIRFDAFMTFIPKELNFNFDDFVTQAVTVITSALGNFAKNTSVGFVTKLPSTLISLFLCFISSFFFIKDKQLISDAVSGIMPDWLKLQTFTLRRGFLNALSAYLRAQLIIMSVVAAVTILGFTILQYPYALLIGVLVSVVDALPIIGSSVIFWPWALYSLITGNYTYAIGLLAINAVNFLTRQILEPKVLGSQMGAHPLLVLVSIYVGLRMFGFWGILIGPILLVTVKLVLKENPVPDGDPPEEVFDDAEPEADESTEDGE